MIKGEEEFRPERLPPWACELTSTFDVASTVEAVVVADLAAAWPDRTHDVEFVDLLRASVTENVDNLVRSLAGNDVETPLRRPAEFARAQAQLRIRQAALQRSYRAGLVVIWQRWIDHLTRGARTGRVDPESLTEAVRRSTLLLFRYLDRALNTVASEFSRVEQLMQASGEQIRHHVVRQLLLDSGDPLPVRDLYLTLGYDVSGAHVAVQMDGLDGELDAVSAQVRRECRAMSLRYEVKEKQTVIWFGRAVSWTAAHLDTLGRILADAGVPAAVSTTASGVDGLRSTFGEIQQVNEVRMLLGPRGCGRVISFDDVRLEALLWRDLPQARRFALAELGRLAGDNPEIERLRETVLVWLASGSSVETAQALQLHEHTVRNRLRRAEEHLGHSVSERRIEVGVALRLLSMMRHNPDAT